MGYPMAERLLKAGHSVAIWNRTSAKAEPLARKGGTIVDRPSDLSGQDIVFSMVSTGKDLEQVYFGPDGLVADSSGPRPKILVDCSSIGSFTGPSPEAHNPSRGTTHSDVSA
jgi:3-hydroxyisobutyrate dehydrogenase